MSNSTSTGLQLLKTTHVGSIFPDHPSNDIVCFSKTDPLSTVFKGLVDARILSAPVYDAVHRSHNRFVDMVDIVAYFVTHYNEKELSDPQAIQPMMSEPCSNISDASGRDPFLPVESTAPLQTAVMKMVKWKVHRIPVIDSEGELMTLITQSQVLKFLYQNMSKYGDLAYTSVGLLCNMVHSPVTTIPLNAKVIEAFKMMQEKRISAVAVVDGSGKLVGNISVSDLKLIGYDGSMFSRLHYPVSQFLKLLTSDNNLEAPITVSSDSKFREVVSKLVLSRIHRVYLTNEAGVPTGVITQHEVLAALLHHLGVIVY